LIKAQIAGQLAHPKTRGIILPTTLETRCRNLLAELGMITANEPLKVHALTGGVASDIARVEIGDRTICAKFALPKLKVQADWYAPVHRNAAEFAWLQVAASIVPESAVTLFGQSEIMHGFAMEFVQGDDVYLWKTALLAEDPDDGVAASVGTLMIFMQYALSPIFCIRHPDITTLHPR
jgi:5-methylthioribose kinase